MGYEYSDDAARIDAQAAWDFLSTSAYWARWRAREDFDRQLAGAWRVVGCYETGSGAMVGFARAFSDGVAMAYLADVFVLPEHRGQRLGVRLVEVMVEEGPGADFRWLLHTADAHALYERLGFAEPTSSVLERPHISARRS